MSTSKLTILVAPSNEAGHINACIYEAKPFKARGHQVIFVVPETWKGKLSSYGFIEHLHPIDNSGPVDPNVHPGEHYAKVLHQYKLLGDYSPLEKLKSLENILNSETHKNEIRFNDAGVKEAIEMYKPDVIIVDSLWLPPSVHSSGIPWVKSLAMSPLLMVWYERIPPGGSGLPSTGDRSQWDEFNKIRQKLFHKSEDFSKLLVEMGYKPYANDVKFPSTEILTVYACPEELNFPEISKNGWHNLEAFNKEVITNDTKLEDFLPKEFIENNLSGTWSGKYIYVSMGSLASVDVELMQRVTTVLAKTAHKYIVSKGPRHDQYELPENMWGNQYLPQTKIVPFMNLVITHGGNNSVTETFARGIPMIAMPIFADQFDNAQRLQETGFGIRVDPYTFNDRDLIEAVEKMLADEKLKERLEVAAKRIQNSNRHEVLVDKVERLVSAQK